MKTIPLSKALGFTITEATQFARLLGHRHVRFVTARSSSRQGPRVAHARPTDGRGARFMREAQASREHAGTPDTLGTT